MQALFKTARERYHQTLAAKGVLSFSEDIASVADSSNRASKDVASSIFHVLGIRRIMAKKLAGQTAGREFEIATAQFLRDTFGQLAHLRPGEWSIRSLGELGGESSLGIANFEQYKHLTAIANAARDNADLAAMLGTDYIIKPDVVVVRGLVDDAEVNRMEFLVDETVATAAALRNCAGHLPVMHASVSCKLTIRSDRSQNSRSEALNLIRNRRGRLPHIVVVTAEPLPSRLASVALGSGDIDCVYHVALQELTEAVRTLNLGDSEESLAIMTNGNRLKDISDLPLDLAV